MALYDTAVKAAMAGIGASLILNLMNGLSTRVGLFNTNIEDAFVNRVSGGSA